MKNTDAWELAQNYCGGLWRKLGQSSFDFNNFALGQLIRKG